MENNENEIEYGERPAESNHYEVLTGPFVLIPTVRGIHEIRNLLNSIKARVGSNAFICGGYARYCASPLQTPPLSSDIDIYSSDEQSFESLKEFFKHEHLEVKHENDVSLSYRRPKDGPYSYHLPIQLIKPMKVARIVTEGGVEEILRNFDFTIIRCAIMNEDYVLADPNFIHDENGKLLRLINIHCPVSSTLRCMKYSKRGYWLRPLECLKLFVDWSDRDEDYRIKLIDFLTKANGGNGLSEKEVDELEALMRID